MSEIPHKNHREEVLEFTEDSCVEELADVKEAFFRAYPNVNKGML